MSRRRGSLRRVSNPVIDLNADLGEGGPADRELLELVTSASVACGFHAGDPLLMLHTAQRATAAGVVVGAHPSYDDREGFGRRDRDVDPESLHAQLVYQLGALEAVAHAAGTRVRFVKPHGALYNRAAADTALADVVIRAVGDAGPYALLALAGSPIVGRARAAGLTVHEEGFADRAYAPDGTLLPRSVPGAVIEATDQVVEQALALALGTGVRGADGRRVHVTATSICVHGDTPGALELARSVRSALAGAGVTVRSFA